MKIQNTVTRASQMMGLMIAMLSASASLCAQVDPNRVVVTINGEEVKGDEYYYRMEFLPGVGRRNGNTFTEFPPGFLTLEQIITERLLLQLAKQQDVYPSDLEVQDELARRIKRNPKLVTDWTATGRHEDELKYQVRYELAQFKLATFGVTITDLEVEDYYKKNPELFTTPKQYKLRVIVVSTADDKNAVDQDLAAGKSFADVATARSVEASKAVGGEYGTVPETILGQSTKAAIEVTKIGQMTAWVASPDNSGTNGSGTTSFVKFLVEDVIPPALQPLTLELKEAIRNKRMLQMGSIKNNLEMEMVQMRSKAKIDIQQKAFADAYAKYIAAYLKQQSTKP